MSWDEALLQRPPIEHLIATGPRSMFTAGPGADPGIRLKGAPRAASDLTLDRAGPFARIGP